MDWDFGFFWAFRFRTPTRTFFLLKKILEPVGWKFRISFQSIFVIHIVDAKSNRVTVIPFKVVKQRPCKVSFHINAVPANIYTIMPIKLLLKRVRMKFWCFVKHLLDRGMKIIKMTIIIVNSVIIDKGFLTRQFGISEFTNSYNII